MLFVNAAWEHCVLEGWVPRPLAARIVSACMMTHMFPCLQLQDCVLTNDPAADLAWICELSGLQEAKLGFILRDSFSAGDWLSEWVPPQPGLSRLQRLELIG